MSTPSTRPVHPCVLSVWDGNTGGAEYSTWARITPSTTIPQLVTAQGSTLTVYSMDEPTGKLLVDHKFTNLAGSVCFLATLEGQNGDALLIGFTGYPRLSVATVTPDLLLATSLLDLTLALQEASMGATTPLEQDLHASVCQSCSGRATAVVILGGGVAVACLELSQNSSGWSSSEPYLLPLSTLSANIVDTPSAVVTGFGDILNSAFLLGYSEPTMVLLHSSLAGQTWSGRLGRTEGGTRNGLMVTAITVTVAHERSAILWSTEVPSDALQVYCTQGCLVQCVNSIVAISNTGQVQQVLATNGWAPTTLPLSLMSLASANPWPFPALSVALDGAEFSFVSETTAFVVLRSGPVYLLQYTNAWSILPLYTTIGALGQVASVRSFPLGSSIVPSTIHPKLWDKTKAKPVEMGLLFVGSRLGDSTLLGYGLGTSSVADAIKKEPGLSKAKAENNDTIIPDSDDEYDRILKLEEEALYAATDGEITSGPDVVPPSDDDESIPALPNSRRKRARLSQLTVVQSLTVLDSLTALGPLGPGCIGPLSQGKSQVLETTGKAPPALGATGYIYPCGYGSSGGVALLTVPGRDDRTILAEEDCINAKAMFNLPTRGLVLLSMSDRIRFMKVEETGGGSALKEIDMTEWTSKELRTLFQTCELLAACERNDSSFCLLICMKVDEKAISYSLLVVNDKDGKLRVETNIPLPVPEGEAIRSVAPIEKNESTGQVMMGYTLSTGQANIVTLDAAGGVQGFSFEAQVPMDMENGDNEEVTAEEKFYRWGTVTAIDIFKAPNAFFPNAMSTPSTVCEEMKTESLVPSKNKDEYDLDEEDKVLYSDPKTYHSPATESVDTYCSGVSLAAEGWFVAVVRQSGMLEVYSLDDLTPGQDANPLWTSPGCSHGAPLLTPKPPMASAYRIPKQHQVQTSEIRFFFCGLSRSKSESIAKGPRSFCMALETSDGDSMLYRAELGSRVPAVNTFRRIPLKAPGRPSKEQGKHFQKLRRKGIVKQLGDDFVGGFRHNRLFRFKNISRQDGLFAATARPIWFIAERGRPMVLFHRCRHMAPAGARPKPVTGFCAGILVSAMLSSSSLSCCLRARFLTSLISM